METVSAGKKDGNSTITVVLIAISVALAVILTVIIGIFLRRKMKRKLKENLESKYLMVTLTCIILRLFVNNQDYFHLHYYLFIS